MESYPVISFDNTEFAFEHKSDKELRRARFLFSMMGKQWLVKMGTRLTPWSLKVGLPVKGLIRKTIFKQFVGGETLEQTAENWWPYPSRGQRAAVSVIAAKSQISSAETDSLRRFPPLPECVAEYPEDQPREKSSRS